MENTITTQIGSPLEIKIPEYICPVHGEIKNRTMKIEDFDNGVKAAYKLGIMEGQADIRGQLEDMRGQLERMLKTNKNLHEIMSQKQGGEITLSSRFARNIINSLRAGKFYDHYSQLKKKYEAATGIKYEKPI